MPEGNQINSLMLTVGRANAANVTQVGLVNVGVDSWLFAVIC